MKCQSIYSSNDTTSKLVFGEYFPAGQVDREVIKLTGNNPIDIKYHFLKSRIMDQKIISPLSRRMNLIHNLLKDKNILIVEDDKTTIYLIQQLLKQSNANIICASSRMEVEDIINSGIDIHLIIMNILREDGIFGVGLIKGLKSKYPLAPVIVETAIKLDGMEQQCFESGSDAFFLKPWSCDELLNSIQKYCA